VLERGLGSRAVVPYPVGADVRHRRRDEGL
jgi:hypothetical protein